MFPIFYFFKLEKISSLLQILSFFLFSIFLYFFPKLKDFQLPKIPISFTPLHIPHSSSLIPSTSSPLWQVLIGQREHLTPHLANFDWSRKYLIHYLHKNPSILFNYFSFTNLKPINSFPLHFSFFFHSSSPKPKP